MTRSVDGPCSHTVQDYSQNACPISSEVKQKEATSGLSYGTEQDETLNGNKPCKRVQVRLLQQSLMPLHCLHHNESNNVNIVISHVD